MDYRETYEGRIRGEHEKEREREREAGIGETNHAEPRPGRTKVAFYYSSRRELSIASITRQTNCHLSGTRTSRDTRIPRLIAPVSATVYVPLTDTAILQVIADR